MQLFPSTGTNNSKHTHTHTHAHTRTHMSISLPASIVSAALSRQVAVTERHWYARIHSPSKRRN